MVKFGQIQRTCAPEALDQFYQMATSKQGAFDWHVKYTPWLEEKEILALVQNYDFQEIKRIQKKNNEQITFEQAWLRRD